MTTPQKQPMQIYNQLLATFPCEDFKRLQPRMRIVELSAKQIIQRAGEPIERVYFPITAVIALMQTLRDGSIVELGMVGSEGMAELALLLGHDRAEFDMVVRIPGAAYLVPTKILANELHRSEPMVKMLQRYTVAFLMQIVDHIPCARHHTVQQRLASYLLTVRDRVGPGKVRLTHEVLAQALGVGRPTVTLAIDMLQNTGVVLTGRGTITILDRQALEWQACECYGDMRDRYLSLLR